MTGKDELLLGGASGARYYDELCLNFHGFHWSHVPQYIKDGVDQEALAVLSGFRC